MKNKNPANPVSWDLRGKFFLALRTGFEPVLQE